MGSYTWGYQPPNMAYKYSYPTYNPPLLLAMNLQVSFGRRSRDFDGRNLEKARV